MRVFYNGHEKQFLFYMSLVFMCKPDNVVQKLIDLLIIFDMKGIVPNCLKQKHNAISNYHTLLTRKFLLDTCKK